MPGPLLVVGGGFIGCEFAQMFRRFGELIHTVQSLMLAGGSARVLVNGQVAHPAFAEGVQSALMRLDRFALPGESV